MCGITGFIDHLGNTDISVLKNMVEALTHRGPDSNGAEVIKLDTANVGLGHTRLSIIDLSNSGHQPMNRRDLSIVYNGEIYNYKEVKKELLRKGYNFKSDSDTEVILYSFMEWGENCVNRFIGMFAFTILDKQKQKVYFFRDRAGVKPLFIYKGDKTILFASELKSFHVYPRFKKDIDNNTLRNYFDLGYITGNECIFRNVIKVKPGAYIKYDLKSFKFEETTYWNPIEFYQKDKANISYGEAKNHLNELLKSAYSYRMVSDVPVGVFLSGGYDSCSVAAILQKYHNTQIKTFTIGFDYGNNEAPYAKEISKYLNTDHHEYICTAKEAQEIIPKIPYYYDEPFADSSAIPTILVSQFAKKHVTVALSADGGDELFAGYDRYYDLKNFLNTVNKFPRGSKFFSKKILNFLVSKIRDLPKKYKLRVLQEALSIKSDEKLLVYLYNTMQKLPDEIHSDLLLNHSHTENKLGIDWNLSDINEIPLLHDWVRYLPDDILTKVDRATMSASLEGREPLLDHRIFEYVSTLPYFFKSNGNTRKRILKDIVHDYIPQSMMERPKVGFSIPLTKWFKTDLKEYLFDNINSNFSYKYLNQKSVTKILKDFDNDSLHYKPLIWKVLMFNLWLEKWEN